MGCSPLSVPDRCRQGHRQIKSVCAGIDLGGTSIKAAIADQDGKLILHRSIPTGSQDGPESVLDRMASLIESLVDAAQAIGIAAANVVTSIHPQLIVLGGGVAALGDLLIETVRSEITKRVRMFPTDLIRVEATKLGSQAGIIGAIALGQQSADR
jgi:predicted NBD/HSP70 family sugar kinase